MKDRTRERRPITDDSLSLGDNRRVWEWNVRWDAEEETGYKPTVMDLASKWADVLPGWRGAPVPIDTDIVQSDLKDSALWYVSDISLKSTEMRDFHVLSQEWKRVEIANPLQIPFRWTGCETATVEIPAYADVDGKPLITRAGEPILGLTQRANVWRLTGERNVPGFPNWMKEYGASTNSDTVRVGSIAVPKDHLSLQKLSLGDIDDSVKVAGQPILFRKMELEVWWNPRSWVTEVLHQGFYELQKVTQTTKSGGTKTLEVPVRCTNDGKDTQKPVFLNSDGYRPRDKDGNIKTILEPTDIVVLRFFLDKRLPYNPLIR